MSKNNHKKLFSTSSEKTDMGSLNLFGGNQMIVIAALVILIAVPITVYASNHGEQRGPPCGVPPCGNAFGHGGGTGEEEMMLFNNVGQYTAFENIMKNTMDFPVIGFNFFTGQADNTKAQGIDYTVPIFHPTTSQIVAYVDGYSIGVTTGGATPISEADAIALGFVIHGEVP